MELPPLEENCPHCKGEGWVKYEHNDRPTACTADGCLGGKVSTLFGKSVLNYVQEQLAIFDGGTPDAELGFKLGSDTE